MPTLNQRRVPASPASGWRWVGLLTAALFAFQVNHVRIHLLTDVHHIGNSTADTLEAVDHDHHEGEHDHSKHQPHSASDHELQLAAKQQYFFALASFLLPETALALIPPEARTVFVLCEPGSRPGESPPDPAQPRAPPTV